MKRPYVFPFGGKWLTVMIATFPRWAIDRGITKKYWIVLGLLNIGIGRGRM